MRQAAQNGGNGGGGQAPGHHLVSQDEVYRRAGPGNVMHMPDVVSKVTQNSINFSLE